MQSDASLKSIVTPIAIAEGTSTLVSMGAVLAMAHCESALNPARNFVAKKFIYPMIAHKPAPDEIDFSDPIFHKACEKASELIKGTVMIGAGFASHVPIQMALEGHFDAKSFRHVMLNKSIGVTTALGSIMLLNAVLPKTLPGLQKAVCPLIEPYLPKHSECDYGCLPSKEICHLMTLEIPSSIISGFVNYGMTRRMMRAL